MNIIDILFTAGGGGIVGSLIHLGTNFVEHRQKLEEMRVTSELAEKTEAWKAFTASLASDQGLSKLPLSTPAWIAGTYVLVEAFRRFTRPGLTWFGFLLLIWASYSPRVTVDQWNAISFGAWTAAFWWFGSRVTAKGK